MSKKFKKTVRCPTQQQVLSERRRFNSFIKILVIFMLLFANGPENLFHNYEAKKCLTS